MGIILIRDEVDLEVIEKLRKEFPSYRWLIQSPQEPVKTWKSIEVLLSASLSQQELAEAQHLRWVHSPIPDLRGICVDALRNRGNVVVTCPEDENSKNKAEQVFAGLLAMAKSLGGDKSLPPLNLNGKTLLQFGLGRLAREIAGIAKSFSMRTRAVGELKTFQENFDKVYTQEQLKTLLPAADFLTFCPAPGSFSLHKLEDSLIHQMRPDAIAAIMCPMDMLSADWVMAASEKLRGVYWDLPAGMELSKDHKLWKKENVILTRNFGGLTVCKGPRAFQSFRQNLRLFVGKAYHELEGSAFPVSAGDPVGQSAFFSTSSI